MVRTGVTFADACDEYLRYVEHDLDQQSPTTARASGRIYCVQRFLLDAA
jgi:hypothetical protein